MNAAGMQLIINAGATMFNRLITAGSAFVSEAVSAVMEFDTVVHQDQEASR